MSVGGFLASAETISLIGPLDCCGWLVNFRTSPDEQMLLMTLVLSVSAAKRS